MPTKLLQKRLRFLGAVEVRRDQSTSKQLCCDASFSCLCGRASVQHLSYLRSNTEAITQKLRKTTCDDFLTKHLQSSVGLSTGRVIHRASCPQGRVIHRVVIHRRSSPCYPQLWGGCPQVWRAIHRLSPVCRVIHSFCGERSSKRAGAAGVIPMPCVTCPLPVDNFCLWITLRVELSTGSYTALSTAPP